MSCSPNNKTLSERTQYAIERRLFPHTNLTRKQLQHALGISTGTMNNLLSGQHDPSGRVLDKLVEFFRDGFINEVWGGHNIHCIDTRAPERAAAVALVITAQAQLRRLG
jgi:transcriptional regulator with XRE-family HTH domain